MTPLEVIQAEKLQTETRLRECTDALRELEKRVGIDNATYSWSSGLERGRSYVRFRYLNVRDLAVLKELLATNYEWEELVKQVQRYELEEAKIAAEAAEVSLRKARDAVIKTYDPFLASVWIVGCTYVGHWLSNSFEFDHVLGVVSGASVGLASTYVEILNLEKQRRFAKQHAIHYLKEKKAELNELYATPSEPPSFTLDELSEYGITPPVFAEPLSFWATLRTWPPIRLAFLGFLLCCVWSIVLGSLIYWHPGWAALLMLATFLAALKIWLNWPSTAKWFTFRERFARPPNT
jgi:hypothetical protein